MSGRWAASPSSSLPLPQLILPPPSILFPLSPFLPLFLIYYIYTTSFPLSIHFSPSSLHSHIHTHTHTHTHTRTHAHTQLGVGSEDHVVVYDNHSGGMMASPRVWWLFRVSSHNSLAILFCVHSVNYRL